MWDTRTGSAFLELDRLLPEEHQSSQLRRHFPHADTPTNSIFVSGSRLNRNTASGFGQRQLHIGWRATTSEPDHRISGLTTSVGRSSTGRRAGGDGPFVF